MVGEQAHAVVGPRVALSRTPRAVAGASGTVGLEGVEGVFEGLGDPTPRPGFVIDALPRIALDLSPVGTPVGVPCARCCRPSPWPTTAKLSRPGSGAS